MTRSTAFITVFILLLAASASAQPRVEASVSGGYSANSGITSDQSPRLGQIYDTLTPVSGSSLNLTFGVFFGENAEAEFLWSRQGSRLDAEGPSGAKTSVSELTLFNYMGNFVYNWGLHDAKVRPYFFGGLGATQFSFGASLLPNATGEIPSETRFATNWGGGAKFNFSKNVGAKVAVRWTPTYIASTPGGVWCDPFYGCWPVSDPHYTSQFDTSFGLNIRF